MSVMYQLCLSVQQRHKIFDLRIIVADVIKVSASVWFYGLIVRCAITIH